MIIGSDLKSTDDDGNINYYGIDTVKHEYGHTKQLEEVGIANYILFFFIPSASSNNIADYYATPWDSTADWFGCVDRDHDYGYEQAELKYLLSVKNGEYASAISTIIDTFGPDAFSNPASKVSPPPPIPSRGDIPAMPGYPR